MFKDNQGIEKMEREEYSKEMANEKETESGFTKVAKAEYDKDGTLRKFVGQSLELNLSDFPKLKEEEPAKDMLELVVKGPVLTKTDMGLKVGVGEVKIVHGKQKGTYLGFKKLESKIESRPGFKPRNPEQSKEEAASAVTAAIGRKKYGKGKFQKMAAAGKKHLSKAF